MSNESSTQPREDKLRELALYAELLVERAGEAMLARRQRPETKAEIALHKSYVEGLTEAARMPLESVEEEASGLSDSICKELEQRRSFFEPLSGDLPPDDFFCSLYKDERGLAEVWELSPDTAIATAYWQALHDVQTFADYFANHPNYKDDFRSIRTAVERSLAEHDLLDPWSEMVAAHKKTHTSPSLPPARRTGYPPPTPVS